MKATRDFLLFRQGTLKDKIKALENVRKEGLRYKKYGRYTLLAGVIVLIVMIINASQLGGFIIPLSIVGILVFFYLSAYWTEKIRKLNFKKRFKLELLEPTIKFISEDLEYIPHKFIPPSNFRASKLFRFPIASYTGDDYVHGKIGQTIFHFSELFVEQRNKKSNSGKSVAFGGLFFVADFHKNFNGGTYLIPNKAKYRLNWLRKNQTNMYEEKRVYLENQELTKHFLCFADDDITARYILSPSMMESILNFKKKYPKNDIHISFNYNHVFVAIDHPNDLFEPSFNNSIYSESSLQAYFEEIQLVVHLVEKLRLNHRIWTR